MSGFVMSKNQGKKKGSSGVSGFVTSSNDKPKRGGSGMRGFAPASSGGRSRGGGGMSGFVTSIDSDSSATKSRIEGFVSSSTSSSAPNKYGGFAPSESEEGGGPAVKAKSSVWAEHKSPQVQMVPARACGCLPRTTASTNALLLSRSLALLAL